MTTIGRIAMVGLVVTLLALTTTEGAARAELGKRGQLAVGGNLVLGGITGYGPIGGAFDFGVLVEGRFFVIDNLDVGLRLGWERAFYSYSVPGVAPGRVALDFSLDQFPFEAGARYSIAVLPKLRIPVGAGVGLTLLRGASGNGDFKPRFSFYFEGGAEYEIVKNLGLVGLIDLHVPNAAGLETGESTLFRVALLAGVLYHFAVM
jgi:hypothetical protein